MYILIDRDQMCVRYVHPILATINNLAHIEMSACASISGPVKETCTYATFTDLELKILHENLCGQKYLGYDRAGLMNAVIQMCLSLEPCKINGFEVALQASAILLDCEDFYRYDKGSNQPLLLDAAYSAPALVTVAGFTPAVRSAPIANAAPRACKPAASVPAQRNHTASESAAPKSGSKTGRVWEIADSIFEQYPARPTDFKMLRGKIIAACEAEGINSSTASVQYGKWKNTKT